MPAIQYIGGTVSVNDDDADELCALNGIGESLADMIISERSANGLFYYPEDLTAIKGIGIKKLSVFRDELDFD